MADLYTSTYNPDVLSCIANLSSDEVFTPPEVANAMLDMLPQELFSDSKATFLDPTVKSGVFLREIAKRLMVGLEKQIPDLQERVDHIFQKQLFGIAMTEITSLLGRRSLYCSKYPNSRYSVSLFNTAEGNIRYKNVQHRWSNGKCVFCGASQGEYGGKDREGMETHAYELIHTIKPEEIFKMKFDVIIGNPPYQLNTGGGSVEQKSAKQARPIYHLFVEQAKKLQPRYLSMIIPSRWFAGGMGLDEFRTNMLSDNKIRVLVEYANAKDCFPQNSISGGVCYFMWDRDHNGECSFTNIRDGKTINRIRPLNEFPILVRYNEAVDIVHKVQNSNLPMLSSLVSSISPFGLSTKERGTEHQARKTDVKMYSSAGASYIDKSHITKGQEYFNCYKVMISQTGAEHAGEPTKDGNFQVLSSSMRVLNHNEVCTHSYLVIGQFKHQIHAENLLNYLRTKFVRFLLLQAISSIHISKASFSFVPEEDFSKSWTDEELYAKYNLTEEEIAFIESMIRPMNVNGGDKNG